MQVIDEMDIVVGALYLESPEGFGAEVKRRWLAVRALIDGTAAYVPEFTLTGRGFKHLKSVAGAYGGEVKVYESSAAMGPHIWLLAKDPDDSEAIVHLSAEAAWEVAQQMLWLLRNHYQGDATPEDAP